jgi:hypothetical protein
MEKFGFRRTSSKGGVRKWARPQLIVKICERHFESRDYQDWQIIGIYRFDEGNTYSCAVRGCEDTAKYRIRPNAKSYRTTKDGVRIYNE